MKLLRANKNLVQFLLCICLTGCAGTQVKSGPSERDMQTKEVNRVSAETSVISKLTDNIEKNIETVELDKTHKMLVEHLKEWSSVKGNINRLLELESELAYLVNALKQQDELVVLVEPDEIIGDFTAPELLSIDKQNEVNFGEPDKIDKELESEVEGVNNNKFSSNKAATVQTFAAPKLPVVASESKEGVSKAKFSNAGLNSISESTTQLKQNINNEQSCLPNYNQSGKYALHLISVSNKDKIDAAQQQMTEKYNDTLCGKYVKIAQVLIRDIEFSSLRFGPFDKKVDAQNACSEIQASGQYCSVATFDGYTF